MTHSTHSSAEICSRSNTGASSAGVPRLPVRICRVVQSSSCRYSPGPATDSPCLRPGVPSALFVPPEAWAADESVVTSMRKPHVRRRRRKNFAQRLAVNPAKQLTECGKRRKGVRQFTPSTMRWLQHTRHKVDSRREGCALCSYCWRSSCSGQCYQKRLAILVVIQES
jgi:hypothetical protein